MNHETLRQVLDEEIQRATAWSESTIREEQIRNLSYYLGYPLGNESKNRSSIVSWDVFEIIESAMPGFIEPFFSADDIAVFQPRGPEDEEFASQATDYINYLVKDANDGFLTFNTWVKDALLSKVGVVRVEWKEGEPRRQTFKGLTDEQMALLMQDDVEIIEHSEEPAPGMPPMNAAMSMVFPMLHSVTILQKTPGKPCLTNVRPENFVISRDCGMQDDAKVIGEWVKYTRSDLKELGFKNWDTVESYEVAVAVSQGEFETLRDADTVSWGEHDSSDPTLEEVTLFRGFVKADVNGDGIAEWRRVLVGGNGFLSDEEVEGDDYCILTPIPLPHRVIGMAYADPAAEIQKLKTELTRQYLDTLYQANRPSTYVNMTAGVSMEDVLSDRIGKIIRGNGPAADAIQPIQTTLVARDALEGIQLADGMRETRLGIPKYNPGLEADALHKTATGVRSINNLVDKRQKMTLRIIAETGIKRLFKLMLRLVCENQDRKATVRLRNKWVEFDPTAWSADMDVTVDVGIGNSDQTENMMFLQQFGAFMQWGQANGVVTPPNIYEFGRMLAKQAKIKGVEERLLTEPGPPQPAPPPPEIVKAQMDAQTKKELKAMEMQDSAQKFQAEQQTQMQVDANRQEWEARQKQLELQQQAELERIRKGFELQLREREIAHEQWKAGFDRETQIMLARINSEARRVESAEADQRAQNAVTDE